MIQIGKIGKIVKGESEGWYILVQDDTEGTGGYYVLTSKYPDLKGGLGEGFDDWVGSKDALLPLFERCGWEVEWES